MDEICASFLKRLENVNKAIFVKSASTKDSKSEQTVGSGMEGGGGKYAVSCLHSINHYVRRHVTTDTIQSSPVSKNINWLLNNS